MKPRMYLETTIVSYLTARESTELLVAAHQSATKEWWDDRREDYEVFVSPAVSVEASEGDQDAAQRRLAVLAQIAELEITDEARELAKDLMALIPLPPKCELDALHIATATVHAMEYLLTWNCRHIANAALRHRIEEICREAGYEPPIICTPLELMDR